jgi:hypothetical protein
LSDQSDIRIMRRWVRHVLAAVLLLAYLIVVAAWLV